MNASVIRCPGCGAADNSTATPSGVHTCVYCGVRYQLSGSTARTVAPAPAPAARSKVRGLVLGGVALLGVGIASLVFIGGSSKSSSTTSVRMSAGPRALATPANNPPVSVQAAVEETAPATAEFTLESVDTSSNNALWIYGYFHNTSPFTLGQTKIIAVFYDKDGKEIGQGSGFTEDDVIAADARVPSVVLVSDAPMAYDRIAFEVTPQRPSYLPTEVEGLELEADAPRRHEFLGWKYAGKVHNKSGQAAKFVKVRVLAFDQNDKFAGHAYTYASADELADGATARFDGTLLGSSTDFKRFEFRVSGRPAR